MTTLQRQLRLYLEQHRHWRKGSTSVQGVRVVTRRFSRCRPLPHSPRLRTIHSQQSRCIMAARAALGRAFLASGVTIFGLGAATMVVSSVSLGVARVVVTRNKKKTAVTCCVCHGNKKVNCDVCGGEKAVRYHPFKTMPLSHSRMPLTACAMCSASGEQTCLNCLGEGIVNPTITVDAV